MARSKPSSRRSKKSVPKKSGKKNLKKVLREANRRYGKMLKRLAGPAPNQETPT